MSVLKRDKECTVIKQDVTSRGSHDDFPLLFFPFKLGESRLIMPLLFFKI